MTMLDVKMLRCVAVVAPLFFDDGLIEIHAFKFKSIASSHPKSDVVALICCTALFVAHLG
jgi:hypothetical protein